MIRARTALAVLPAVVSVLLAVVGLVACTDSGDRGSVSPAQSALTVSTSSGRLHGIATDRAREFLGVRYGRSVAGVHRWTIPVAAPKASGTVDATKPGPSCAQAGAAPGASATASVTEDCLFLNVTTPGSVRAGEHLPVMVWWHGGGYTSGSGATYDAQRFASEGHVIVVTVNYRLGVFGYLSLPGLAGSGDFGLADQILATHWAKRNAAAFGGDPHNITVFGESAGAMSACASLTSPAATGLIDKVAMSSGGTCQLDWPRDGLVPGAPAQTPYASLADAQSLGAGAAKTLGCTGVAAAACLRGKPTAQLLKIFPLFSDVLAYGTPLLPRDPAAAIRSGQFRKVPVLSTGNRDEQWAFVGGAQKVKPFFTAASYPVYLRKAFGARAGAVAQQYPLRAYPDAATAWATVITDRSWACPTLRGNAAAAEHGATVFGGEFADRAAPDVNGVRTATFDPGAAHASDVPYLFDLSGKSLLRTSAQKMLARTMVGYWSSFARSGRPTAAGASAWPALSGSGGPSLQLAAATRVADLGAEHRCTFWSRR